MIAGFMAITGWSASMTRAGLVAGLSLWAWYYGRAFHPVTLLAFAAAVTTVIYPAYAWGDLGWALSFAAFAGVIVLAPLLHAFFYGGEKPGFVAQIFIETVAAQIMTLPILLGAFGKFSIIALVSNILVLPLVPLAMLLSFLVGMCQLLVPAAAHIATMPAGIVLGYMVWVVEWTAKVSWAQIFCPLPWWGVLLAYSVIAGACIYLKRSTHYNLRQVNVVE
jgi:competence protein ComEC